MILPKAPAHYDAGDQNRTRAELSSADRDNFKKGQNMELARKEQLILRSPNGARWLIGVDDAGALSASAL